MLKLKLSKRKISLRVFSLMMAVLMALPFSMLSVFADGIGDGRGNVYTGMINVPSYAYDTVRNLMDGSTISQAKNGAGVLKYYRKSDNSLVPLYCVEPGIDLHTGDNLDLNSYIYNKTNNSLTEKGDVEKMLGRLFLFAYTGEATDLAEPMAQYFASQLLVWEIVAGERDLFFNHISNSNGGNVCDVLNSMNSSVANRVRGYYNSYVTQMKDHMKMPSFTSLRESSAQVFSVDSSGKAVLTDTNNVLSNFTFSSDTGTVSVSGNKLTVTVDAGKTATITASKKANTQKRVMFCYGASGVQTVVSVGSLEADPRNAFVKVKGLEKGVLEIIKTSDDGVVSNISFTVTGGGKTYNVKTNANGKISIPDLTVGTYTVTETVPVRYQTQQSKTVTVQAGKTASVSFANVLKKGSIRINKQAEDGEISGRTFTISGDGKTYTVTTNSGGIAILSDIPVYDSNNNKINYIISEKNVLVKYVVPANQSTTLTADVTTTKTFQNILKKGSIRINKQAEDGEIGGRTFTISGGGKTYTVTTNSDGIAILSDIPVYDSNNNKITYMITEKNVPVKYVIPANQSTTLTADVTTTKTFANVLKKGSIRINKQAEDGEICGRSFEIKGNGKAYTISTNNDGIAILSDIPVYDSGDNKITYTISEKNVPVKYVVPAEQTATLTADVTTTKTFVNVLKRFTLTVQKQDGETKTAQGNGTLSGAVYSIYENGKLIDSYTTDKNGYFKTKEYICGEYIIKEISPSEGYLLDPTKYAVGAEPKHYTLEKNAVFMTVNEEIIKGNITIIKHSDDGSTQIETPEKGAEFEIYLKSSGSFEKAKESEKDVLICDENGYAKSKSLPYGVYIVRQIKGFENTQSIHDFEVNISENTKTYRYIINNAVKKSLVKIIKKDTETGKVIAVSGIGFKVWDKANKSYISQTINYPSQIEIDTFYTDNSGTLMLPQELAYGEYELHEVQTAQGYWLGDEVVSFTIDGEEKVVEVEKYNKAQKGKISVQKSGDVFANVAVSSSAYLDENGKEVVNPTTYMPVFEEKGLENAVFEVSASEDIITADGTIHAKKGNVVAEITTDKNGYAETDLLHLGKYEIREKIAPYGYIQNGNARLVELTYAGQEIEERDMVNTDFFNDYQGIEISLEKVMEQDKIFSIGVNNEYLNVRFGLFADEEITAWDGTTIPKNGLITEVFLDENMTTKFAEKIPFGRYYVQEISTDEHYILNGEKYLVNFEYMGQEMQMVSVDLGVIENKIKRGSVRGLKLN